MRGGFADLNLPQAADGDAHAHRERLALALRLGYTHVATVHVADAATLGDSDRCRLLPVDVAVQRAAAPGGRAEASQPLLRPGGSAESGAELVQHTRLTVVADEPAHCARLAAAGDVTRTYDLLAVQPESERAFASACTTLDVDIITFDLARRLPFRLRAPTVRAALARGIVFELCYAPALREPTLRRQLFANALAVVHATGGAGIILSSGALRAFELRGPHDVANLGTLFSLPLAAAKEAVASRMLAVLQHARARRAACVGRQVLPLAAQPEGSAAAEATLAWPARPAAALPPAPAAREDTRDRDADAGFLRL